MGVEGAGLDGDHERPAVEPAVLPAADQGRQPRTRARRTASATAGRRTPTSGRSWTRASSTSCATASSRRRTRPCCPRCRSIDRELKVSTPNGPFWRRYTFDGYGETRTGGEWRITDPGTGTTLGRAWPLLAGERGEYTVTAGGSGDAYLTRDGARRPGRPTCSPSRSGTTGRRPARRCCPAGEGTRSATPLTWSHAGLVRLAWTIQRGHARRPAGGGGGPLHPLRSRPARRRRSGHERAPRGVLISSAGAVSGERRGETHHAAAESSWTSQHARRHDAGRGSARLDRAVGAPRARSPTRTHNWRCGRSTSWPTEGSTRCPTGSSGTPTCCACAAAWRRPSRTRYGAR